MQPLLKEQLIKDLIARQTINKGRLVHEEFVVYKRLKKLHQGIVNEDAEVLNIVTAIEPLDLPEDINVYIQTYVTVRTYATATCVAVTT